MKTNNEIAKQHQARLIEYRDGLKVLSEMAMTLIETVDKATSAKYVFTDLDIQTLTESMTLLGLANNNKEAQENE